MLIDDSAREALAVEVDFSLPTMRVSRIFDSIIWESDLPQTIRFDHGLEFTSLAMLKWGAEHQVNLHFIEPGKPTQNGLVESLNGRIRDEFLNAHSFSNIYSARQLAAVWRDDYNESRPHSSLRYLTPKAFAAAYEINPPSQLSVA